VSTHDLRQLSSIQGDWASDLPPAASRQAPLSASGRPRSRL